ncbi:DUF2339 domain-containing protein [Halomicroarcula sp. S1AR25-4]|uniref:hypothetical protein n=1 Tax=Haloarcula sp. S1AR25-4 TaxID=2950538 RepID=UPI0028742B84|nr:hypothetical protein [Halomicroarcula sp. S1AR25-4]MDS0280082.1 DUF2339 domain-containing protein [Halomicroarcula sp. S1AR25-4]
MFRQHWQSIQQWYSTTDWDDTLATVFVAWLFAIPGGTVADYVGISHFVQQGTVNLAPGWLTAFAHGVAAATIGIPFLFGARWLVRRLLGRSISGLPAILVLATGCALAIILQVRDLSSDPYFAVDVATFAHNELLVGVVWWGLVFGTASVGLWLRDRQPRLHTGATPVAAVLLVAMVVFAGMSAGMVAPADDSDSENYTYYDNPHNRTAYLDAEAGPELTWEMEDRATEPVPLSESAFACRDVTHSEYTVNGAVVKEIPATDTHAADRITVQRFRFENGTTVPNRVKLTVDVPTNATHLRSEVGSPATYGQTDRLDYRMGGRYTATFSTEWTQPGAFTLTFAYEDGTTERYYAGLCPSQEVS